MSPAKHSYAWQPGRCDYRTDARTHRQTHGGQSDPYVPLCFAGDTKRKIIFCPNTIILLALRQIVEQSRIEKVPRGIQDERSSKDMASSRNLVSTIGAQASPKMEDGTKCPEGKRSLLACHTRCKCSKETTYNSVKVKLCIKVMKLVESLIGWEVTVGQGSDRMSFNICERETSYCRIRSPYRP